MARPLVNPVQRTVPRDWHQQLAALWPRSDQTSWPLLIWEAGYPWEPVERWIIYEMHPAHTVDREVLAQLERATPPQGSYDHVLEQYVPEDGCLITTRAWKLFQEYRCWGRPFWVIQGSKGGHKRWFSESEKRLLKHYGLPSEPAAPGDLPYAPFDNRVIDKLAQHDLLRDLNGRVRAHLGTKKILTLAGFRRREDENAREFRKVLLGWLSDQIAEIAPDVTSSLLALDAPRRDIDVNALEARQEADDASFIETGRPGSSLIH